MNLIYIIGIVISIVLIRLGVEFLGAGLTLSIVGSVIAVFVILAIWAIYFAKDKKK